MLRIYRLFYYFLKNFLRPKPATPIRTMPSSSMEVCSEIVSFKFSAKACPVNTKLIKNIANKEAIKTINTFFMNFLLLQKSNFNIKYTWNWLLQEICQLGKAPKLFFCEFTNLNIIINIIWLAVYSLIPIEIMPFIVDKCYRKTASLLCKKFHNYIKSM